MRTSAGSWYYGRATRINNVQPSDEWETISFSDANSVTSSVPIGSEVRFAEGRKVADSLGGQFGLWSRPMRILQVSRRDPYNNIDVPVDLIGENEYVRLSRKHMEGATTCVWYQPFTDYGKLHVWPTGNSSYTDLVMQCQFHASDMDASTDNPDFPIEWGNALIFNLAHDLATEYGISREERIDLYTIGQGKLKQALDFNVENANVILTMQADGR
jgi:hypothetical protein